MSQLCSSCTTMQVHLVPTYGQNETLCCWNKYEMKLSGFQNIRSPFASLIVSDCFCQVQQHCEVPNSFQKQKYKLLSLAFPLGISHCRVLPVHTRLCLTPEFNIPQINTVSLFLFLMIALYRKKSNCFHSAPFSHVFLVAHE